MADGRLRRLIGGEYILFATLLMMASGGIAALSAVLWKLIGKGKRNPRRKALAIPYAPHILIGTAVWLYAPAAATAFLRALVFG